MCPMWGFNDVKDYYDHAYVNKRLHNAAVPIVFINARDDPFLDLTSLPTMRDVVNNDNIAVVTTRYGGHLAWINSMTSPLRSPSFAEKLGCEILVNMAE